MGFYSSRCAVAQSKKTSLLSLLLLLTASSSNVFGEKVDDFCTSSDFLSCSVSERILGNDELSDKFLDVTPCAEQPKVAGFSIKDALDFALASDLAYKIKKKQEYNIEGYGFSRIYQFTGGENNYFFGDNAGYVGIRQDGKIVLAFTGTTSVRNIMTDLRANWAKDHKNGGVYHNGILEAYRSVEEDVLKILTDISKDKNTDLNSILKDTVITGHSLGGGMALIASDILTRQGYNISGVLTYAAPRVLDMITAIAYDQQMKDKTLVIKQITDPVPVINLSLIGAKQAGHQLAIPFDLECFQHKMEGYINALRQLDYNNGWISVQRYSMINLQKYEEKWDFESDKTKDAPLQTMGTVLVSLAIRACHRIVLDTAEGACAVAKGLYEEPASIYPTLAFVASNTWAAVSSIAVSSFKSALWVNSAYQDKDRPLNEKIQEAIVSVSTFVTDSVISTANVVNQVTTASAPIVSKAFSWIYSKTKQRTFDFAKDVSLSCTPLLNSCKKLVSFLSR